MMNSSAGDTVNPTKTTSTTGETSDGGVRRPSARAQSNPVARKRQLEPLSAKTEVPTKTPRHGEHPPVKAGGRAASRAGSAASPMRIRGGSSLISTLVKGLRVARKSPKKAPSAPVEPGRDDSRTETPKSSEGTSRKQTPADPEERRVARSSDATETFATEVKKTDLEETRLRNEAAIPRVEGSSIAKNLPTASHVPKNLKRPPEDVPCNAKVQKKEEDDCGEVRANSGTTLPSAPERQATEVIESETVPVVRETRVKSDGEIVSAKREEESEETRLTKKPPVHPDALRGIGSVRRDDSARMRKTIQWLEEGARRMREDLAATRAELHEERRAARLARRELDAAVREARTLEAAKYQQVVTELKNRLSQSPSRSATESATAKTEFLKDENHRREISALKKRLAEAEASVQKLKSNSVETPNSGKRRKVPSVDSRKLEAEVRNLRAVNKKLEEKLNVATEAERARATELRMQHENHDAELAALQKTLRSDTIKMMDEIRSKTREIEKLEKLVQEGSQMHRRLQTKENDLMRKLRESERNHQVRLAPRIDVKISGIDNAVDLCKGDCEAVTEVERLRELAVEQQEAIEVLRQAVKEKERKLDQLSNKKKKEEFYKQWLELEPVAEVDDEEEHEEGDSALSSAPSSLSPQPGGCGQWQANGVTREAYEAVLLEVEELQTRLFEEQQELAHAKSQVRDLEKALLQETRGSQNSRRALSDKLRESEEREATLLAEISELREQNELLEFRVLELEETPCPRDTLDPAESTIVSPEPIHLYKDQLNKQRDRAVATVIPYNTYTHPASPVPQKPPLSLQESGIFEEEEEEEENDAQVELASRGTQTEAPAGELLQEVQRLHELRARIQERAVRVPVPMADAKSCSPAEVTDTVDVAQLTSYQERIRELEVRLGTYEDEVDKRTRERQVSKQREEDLLDENYRLTERVCWFESELRNYEAAGKIEKSDAMTETDSFPVEVKVDDENLEQRSQNRPNLSSPSRRRKALRDTIEELNSGLTADEKGPLEMNGDRKTLDQIQLRCAREECVECRNLWTDYDRKIQCLSRAEYCLKEQIADLERRERAFTNTLQQADSTWSQMESDYVGQLEELRTRLNEKVCANRQLLEQLTGLEEDIRRYRKLSICNLCKKPARDADEVDHVGGVLTEATGSEPKVTPMEVDPPDDLRSSEAKNSGDCVRPKKSEITRATQTDESTGATDRHSSAKSVPELTQPPAVKTNPPLVSREESVSRCGATPSAHSLITVNVPLKNDAGVVAELATEAKEEAFEGEEPRKADEPVAQVRVVPEEQPLEEVEAVVTFTESEPEKKQAPSVSSSSCSEDAEELSFSKYR